MISKLHSRAFSALLVVVALGLVGGSSARADDDAPSPGGPGFVKYVMKKIDDLYRGARSHGEMTMKVRTTHWTRTITLEAWTMGSDYSLMRILRPKKEKGTATLKAKSDLFTYLNKTGRTIKITAGMMGGSWMGSHFTNDDLVKHTRFSEDYTIKLIFDGEEEGVQIYRFELKPKPDAPVVWGKIDVAVRASDLQPLSQLFYDEDGKKVRLLVFSDHAEVGGRVIPKKMVMRPLDGSGEYTELRWRKVDFGIDISKDFFTVQKLKSM
jgi:hypothetical protein